MILMETCFLPANILLPPNSTDMSKWAVIACDQYTSQPEYWSKVENAVGTSPSALNIIYPEVYLNEGPARIDKICRTMKDYVADGTLTQQVTDGFVLVERQISHGTRLGLIGIVDLEQYDFMPDAKTAIRATEGTVLSRIPPRVKIRENAALECPHVMLLINDAQKELIEPIAANKDALRKLYDFDLMLGGGHIAGYAVEGLAAKDLADKITAMQQKSGSLFLAVGDGNHSLATAKTCWENIKKNLSPEEAASHPARYSLVEIINLHDDSLLFEPIHRVVFGADETDMTASLGGYVKSLGMSLADGSDVVFEGMTKKPYSINGIGSVLPVALLQDFLDKYLKEHSSVSIDYVHGEDNVKKLVHEKSAMGILLKTIDKSALFPAIEAGGVLPRKTFSIGEADEKRFYIECRMIAK
jgi:uncharacterized protein (DUF1015 family)